ncbi:hypothetical protein [Streptomyces sp. SS8]
MTTVRKALAAVVAAGLLAACGTGGGAGGTGGSGTGAAAGGSDKPPTGAEKPLETPVKAPEGFDTSKGWQETVTWLPKNDEGVAVDPPVSAVPGAGLVAFLQRRGAGYAVEARDAVTGALRWRGEEWRPPERDDTGGTSVLAVPRILTATQGGREYVVVWAHGTKGEDALSKGKEVFSFAVWPAGSSGKSVAPAHVVDVPLGYLNRGAKAYDAGEGVLLRAAGDSVALIDVAAGRFGIHGPDQKLPVSCAGVTECDGGEVEGMAPDGPVVSVRHGGFGVSGAWLSRDAVPPGADPGGTNTARHGTVEGFLGDHVLSSWDPPQDWDDPRPTVWAAHDLKTGALKASVSCRREENRSVSLSPNGRYAVAGSLAFDLERGRAHCLEETDERKGVRLLSVGDDGTAYGFAGGDEATGSAPVAVSLATGEPEALPQDTEIPFLSLPKAGAFSPMADGGGLLFVFHPRG